MAEKQSKPRLTLGVLRTERSGGHFFVEMEVAILFGKNPGAGTIRLQLNGVDYSAIEISDREAVRFKNLAIGEHTVRVTATTEDENSNPIVITATRSLTLVHPDLKLDVPSPVKVGNSWQVIITATAFIPGKDPRIVAKGEEVEFFLDNTPMALLTTNDAGIATFDLRSLSEGQHVIAAVLSLTGQKSQMTIQVGEKPGDPKRITYSKISKLGSMGTTILRITVLNEKGLGVKDVLVRIEDPTLQDGCAEHTTNNRGEVVHEGSCTETKGRRGISITVPGANLLETVVLHWQTERAATAQSPNTQESTPTQPKRKRIWHSAFSMLQSLNSTIRKIRPRRKPCH